MGLVSDERFWTPLAAVVCVSYRFSGRCFARGRRLCLSRLTNAARRLPGLLGPVETVTSVPYSDRRRKRPLIQITMLTRRRITPTTTINRPNPATILPSRGAGELSWMSCHFGWTPATATSPPHTMTMRPKVATTRSSSMAPLGSFRALALHARHWLRLSSRRNSRSLCRSARLMGAQVSEEPTGGALVFARWCVVLSHYPPDPVRCESWHGSCSTEAGSGGVSSLA